MDKIEIVKALNKELEVMLDGALAEAENANDAANHAESKAENKYDTRGLEATYISQALAARSVKIKEDIYNLSKVDISPSSTSSVGSLVSVYYVTQDKEAHYFLLPCGGLITNYKGTEVKSLSLDSPLGRLLFKKSADDVVKFRGEEIEISKIY